MYDDWGNEIAVSDVALPLAWAISGSQHWVVDPVAINDPCLGSDITTDLTASDAFTFILSDDPFLLPQSDETTQSAEKRASSEDDWLRPLFQDAQVDDVIVTGTPRRASPGFGGGAYDGDGYDGHDTDQGAYQDEQPRYLDFCDAASDNAAVRIKETMDNDPNINRKEHVSLIFTSDWGVVRNTPVFEGTSRSVNIQAALDWLAGQGFGISNITGMVHNHDRAYYGQTSDERNLNRYPSDIDWEAAEDLIGRGANEELFRHYIIDPSGRMREFGYEDRAKYENLRLDQKINGKDLPGEISAERSACY